MSDFTAPHVARKLAGGPLQAALMAQIPAALAPLPRAPRLVVVRVGDNPASAVYVRRKLEACAKVGIAAEEIHMPVDDGETALHSLLHGLAKDDTVDAVIVQLPLPEGWNARAALELVPAAKDCDGLTSANAALRAVGDASAILPATPLGVMRMLEHIGQPVVDVKVAVIGKGLVVGSPLREMLRMAGSQVVEINRATLNPAALCKSCDVVIAAAGMPGLVDTRWVKDGAVVVDVGLSRVEIQGKPVLRGDVEAASVAPIAGWLTPVPGGVGPMTVASLLTNIVDCALMRHGLSRARWVIPSA